jgi:hypothetical protein
MNLADTSQVVSNRSEFFNDRLLDLKNRHQRFQSIVIHHIQPDDGQGVELTIVYHTKQIVRRTPFVAKGNTAAPCQPEIRHEPGNERDLPTQSEPDCLFALRKNAASQCLAK